MNESLFHHAARLREIGLALPRASDRKAVEEIADALHRMGVLGTDTRYDEAKRRCDAILTTIYSMDGYLGADGEIDTAAKFRAIERLARLDWDEDGMPRGA